MKAKKIDLTVMMSVWRKDDPNLLKQAICSILNQTLLPNYLLIGIDGPVTKKLELVINEFSKRSNVKIFWFKENRGLAWVLNDLLREVQTELVGRMDADDFSLAERFEKQIPFFSNDPELSVLGAGINMVNNKSEKLRNYPTDHNSIFDRCPFRNPIAHPTVIIRTNALKSVGGYPEIRRCQDWALWGLMLSKGYKFGNLSLPVLDYRTGENFKERRNLQYLKDELSVIRFFRKIGFISIGKAFLSSLLRIAVRII
ncbi:MAG: glycosyltransferase [Porticoccaceae bacterium]